MQSQGGNSSILSAKSQTNKNPYLGNFTWKIWEMQIGVVNQSQVNHQFKMIMLKYVPVALSITAVGSTRIPLIKASSFTGHGTGE